MGDQKGTILESTVWVMVGVKDEDWPTTCMLHEQMEVTQPSWGLSTEFGEKKKHIMCYALLPITHGSIIK